MANKFWVGGTGTWDSTTTTHWSLTTGGSAGAAAPVTGDTVTFDASSGGGTVTVDSTINGLSLTSITAGTFTGTLDFSVNNPSLTFTAGTNGLSLSGTGVRTIKLGTGTFTFNSATCSYDCGTATNLTATFSGATFSMSATTANAPQIFNGGGQTYGTLLINGRTGGTAFNLNGANTFGTITATGPVLIALATSTTQTVTNLNINGTLSSYIYFGNASDSAGTCTVAVTTPSVTNAVLRGMVFTTSAVTANSSIDLGLNNMNGGSIIAPTNGASTGGGIIGS